MKEDKIKIPYKLFAIVVAVVSFLTILIMNYNPVPITFIFFTIKAPLTLLFFIFLIIGALISTIYWKNKYKKLKNQLERTKKLLLVKEQIYTEEEIENGD